MIIITAITASILNTAWANPEPVSEGVTASAPKETLVLPDDPLAEARRRARLSDLEGARSI